MKSKIAKIIASIILYTFFSCASEDVTNKGVVKLNSQIEVDEFDKQNYSEISTLEISGDDISNLTSLAGVSNIENITIINNPKLCSLKGLEQLSQVNSNLRIINNRSLGNFEAIKEITVSGEFIIENNLFNPRKENLKTNYRLAQKIHQGSLWITTKQEFENFISEQYTEVNGNLGIVYDPEIISLIGMESLTKVTGEFVVTLTGIENLEGLENLESTGNYRFKISENPKLKSLKGIENLKSIGQNLSISSNPSLENLEGMKSLTVIPGWLGIYNCDKLVNLKGLENIIKAGKRISGSFPSEYHGGVSIKDNDNLISFEGLDNLPGCFGGIEIEKNNSLENFKGLESFTFAYGVSKIKSNKKLSNFEGLKKVGFYKLSITNNEALINLEGFNNVKQFDELTISENHSLKNLSGLNGLERVTRFKLSNNNALVSLSGIENLSHVGVIFSVTENSNLTDFCAFNLNTDYLNLNGYIVENNGYNPTIHDLIVNGNCKL